MQDVALGIKSLESSMMVYFCKQTKPNYLKLSHTSSQCDYILLGPLEALNSAVILQG